MSDLRDRAPAHAVMERVVAMRGTADLTDLPLGMIKPSKDGMNWIRGANGELLMAAQLGRLGPDWTVLHSVPVGERGSDIDHIAIGPAGIFAINAKRLIDRNVWVAGGRFLVDGSKRDYLRNSAFEAKRVETVLRAAGIVAPITPIIAISGCKRLTVKSQPIWDERRVHVVLVDQVVRRLRKRPPRLSNSEAARIAAIMSDPKAWSRRPAELTDAGGVRSAYDLVDRGVGRYRLALIAVLVLIVGAAAAVAWIASSAFLSAL